MERPLDTAEQLRDALIDAPESDYVRVIGFWLSHAVNTSVDPGLCGDLLIDSIVGAAGAHAARISGAPIPDWTVSVHRTLDRIWNPGGPAFFAYSMVHAPADFYARGLFVEEDSLKCV